MAESTLSLEHKVLRALGRPQGPAAQSPQRWLLAVSGGVDSLAMAEVLWRWRRLLRIELTVAHVHHGFGPNNEQNQFRDQAQALVAQWCAEHDVQLLTNAPVPQEYFSEGGLRKFRLGVLSQWFRKLKFDRVVFAHHADDLLETRLLRLLRGVGPQVLKSMEVRRGRVVRPLLQVSRHDIERYAKRRQLNWIEDPSNSQSDESLRNWLRHEWLPQLRRREPGLMNSLSRSLATLGRDEFTETIGPFVGLRRGPLSDSSPARQEDIVARYLRTMGLNGYTQNHIHELLKRLGTKEKSTRFEMLGLSFQVTPDFLWASRV